jgi:hypothetical protein
MARTARDKWAEHLEECRANREAIKAFTEASREAQGNYAYAAGYLESFLGGVIAELPKLRRQEVRRELLAAAATQRTQIKDCV